MVKPYKEQMRFPDLLSLKKTRLREDPITNYSFLMS